MSVLRHISKLRTAAFTAAVLLVSGLPLFAHAQGPGETNLLGKVAGVVGGFIGGTIDYTVVKPIVMFILTFSGWILGLAGVFFNWVVIKTVFQFGTFFGTSPGMLVAWGVLRDISNIGLLFGFIFMGVLLILNVDGGGHGHGGGLSAKKAIPRLIIFAVLLNFSLFASQAIIDVANAFSAQFATLAATDCTNVLEVNDCANDGIAGKVLQMAGIGSIWSDTLLLRGSTDSVVLLGLSLFVIITALVLIAAGIMLVIRVVILSLLMVTSPIGFAGMVIPGLQGVASKWWHMLISQSFFAPVMLLLMFISLKLAESLNPNGVLLVEAFSGEASGVATNMQVLVVFAVVIGFMIASLAAASKMGAMGASFATKSAASLTMGSVGFVGRRTLGRASGEGAAYLRRKGLADNSFGRRIASVGDYGNKASFSLRNVSNKALGKTGIGVDVGTANKTAGHGWHGIEEDQVKKREDGLKKIREAKMAVAPSTKINDEVNEIEKEIEKEIAKELSGNLASIKEQQEKVAAARAKGDESLLAAERTVLGERMEEYNKKKEGLLKNDPRFKTLGEMKKAAKDLKKGDERRLVNEQVEQLHHEANPNIVMNLFTMQKGVAHETAEKILKEFNKSDLEKALKNAMKDGDDKPAHAPTAGPLPASPPSPSGPAAPAH